MKTILTLLVLSILAPFAATQNKSLDGVKIKSIEGPCLQIVGRLCYNSYQVKEDGDWWKTGKAHFGFYSFDDKEQKVTITEAVDCKHPNDRRKWASAVSDPKSTYPIYRSGKVDGLFDSCYG